MSRLRNSSIYIAGILALSAALLLALACGGAEEPTPGPTRAPAATAAPGPTATPRPTAAVPLPTSAPTPSGVMPQQGGTLRHAVALSMKTMDPFFRVDYREQMVFFSIYDSLTQYSPNFEVMPELAESWEFSGEGKVITFTLRDGVTFHDGSPVNAQAVKTNWDQMMDPDYGAARPRQTVGAGVTNWEAVDDSTFRITMERPWRPFLASLAQAEFRVRSPQALAQRGVDEFARNPSGTGPFRFREWIPDRRLVLERNPDYWVPDRPYLDGILFQHVPDHSVQIAMVRTGETDVVDDVTGTEVPLLEGSPNAKIASYDSGRWRGASFSHDREPWSSKALRQAIAYAFDRGRIIQGLLQGFGAPAYTNGNIGWWSDPENPRFKMYDYDPQMAREKLAEAGYPNGITFKFWCQADNFGIQQCETYQAILGEVGIILDIQLVPPSDFWSDVPARKSLAWPDWSFPRGDADPDLRRRIHSDGNFMVVGYSNPRVDALFDEAATVFDIPRAREMYFQIQEMAAEDVVNLPLWREKLFHGLSNSVQNWTFYGDTLLRFRDVWMSP